MPASPPAAPTQNARPASAPRFVSGSLLRHVAVMSGTGAIGLIAIFLVDLINLFYISCSASRPSLLPSALPGWWASFSCRFVSV